MAYLEIDSLLRSDESFRNQNQEHYHKGKSPLELLPINIVNTVPLDCMLRGYEVVIITFWIKGKKDVRINDENKTLISNEIVHLRSYVPSEFCRLPTTQSIR